MDRVLKRHDDDNTFGVILYAAPDPDQTNINVLYKDEACTKLVGYDEASTLIPKVNAIKYVEYSDEYNSIFTKITAYSFGTGGTYHKIFVMEPQVQSGAVAGFASGTVLIKP